MHPEADAFLDAIFDHPADDTPRLVYADWLQEHGQENYAQFIRLQCAAAREPYWSDEANRLWEEIGRVWNRLDEEWWPATRDVWQVPGLVLRWDWATRASVYRTELRPGLLDAIHFRRGLLRLNIPFTADRAIRYSVCWPSIMTPDASLTIDNSPDVLGALASNPVLSHVRHVRLVSARFVGDDKSLLAFLHSPHLRRARVLDLRILDLDPTAVDTLLRAGNLSSVEEVHVSATEEVLARLRSRFPRVNPD